MKALMIFCLLLLTACNRKLELSKEVYIDIELAPYVTEFVADSVAVGRPVFIDNLIVKFQSGLGGDVLGECQDANGGTEGTPNIYINSDNWDEQSAISKKAIMYHELGHCVLFLGHDETMININGYLIAKSIMYPWIQADNIYRDHWNSYVYELFTGVWQ